MKRTAGNKILRQRARPLVALCIALCTGPLYAQATATPGASMEVPLRDPWVPQASRKPATAPPAEGAALRLQVEQKLKRAFDAADRENAGKLTLEQAKAAKLGLIVRHFDEIDVGRTGAVQFDDVKRFLKARGAQLE